MNQEKEMTQMCNSAGEYLAPSVKVVEVKVRRVLCNSGDQTNSLGIWSNAEQEGC